MSQEESQGNEKANDGQWDFGGLGKWARYGFAGIGVFASFVGLVLVVLVYLTLSPQIGALRDNTLSQLDVATSAVGNLDKSMKGAYDAMETVPGLTENLSSGFDGYASRTNKLADGIDSLSSQISKLPGGGGDSAASLKSAADNLRSSAGALSSQATTLSSVSSSMKETQDGIKAVRTDLSKARSNLSKARLDIGSVFDSLSTTLLLGCGMFALVFIALGAYSVALFL